MKKGNDILLGDQHLAVDKIDSSRSQHGNSSTQICVILAFDFDAAVHCPGMFPLHRILPHTSFPNTLRFNVVSALVAARPPLLVQFSHEFVPTNPYPSWPVGGHEASRLEPPSDGELLLFDGADIRRLDCTGSVRSGGLNGALNQPGL